MGDISYYHYLYAIKAGMPTELDMQEIIFDFTGCKYIMKLYDIIQESLAFLTGSEGIECIVGSFKRLRRVPTDSCKDNRD